MILLKEFLSSLYLFWNLNVSLSQCRAIASQRVLNISNNNSNLFSATSHIKIVVGDEKHMWSETDFSGKIARCMNWSQIIYLENDATFQVITLKWRMEVPNSKCKNRFCCYAQQLIKTCSLFDVWNFVALDTTSSFNTFYSSLLDFFQQDRMFRQGPFPGIFARPIQSGCIQKLPEIFNKNASDAICTLLFKVVDMYTSPELIAGLFCKSYTMI